MGLKTLTNTCKFICSCAMAPPSDAISVREPNKTKTLFDNNKELLTDQCKLEGSFGPCRMIPDPAKQSPSGGECLFTKLNPIQKWKKESSKLVINKTAKALTEQSIMICAKGGIIRPVMSPTTKVNIYDISLSSAVVGAAVEKPFDSVMKNTLPPDKNNAVKNTGEFKLENGTSEDNAFQPAENKEGDAEAKTDNGDVDYLYANCDYKDCPERDKCEYLKANYSADSINNDSSVLLENYKTDYPQQYKEYIRLNNEKNNESTEGNWVFAAHHIISGNQIFAKHPQLVKLANYYKYDINNSENCILLPSIRSFDGKIGIDKQANGYVAMDMMKKQWHVGGHSYKLDSETVEAINLYLQRIAISSVSFYRNYVEAVEHEINIFESKYQKSSCRKKEYEVKRMRFINGLNNISHRVGARISEFENGYKRSYPFYVSKEACKFAFDVPNKKKFIIIYNKKKYKTNQIAAVKLSVTRYKKDNYKVIFSNNDEFIVNDDTAFIIFADNIRYFINLTSDRFIIPWKIDPSREYVLNDEMIFENVSDYCADNEQKIISFVEGRENGEMYYEPPARIIKQRLSNVMEE